MAGVVKGEARDAGSEFGILSRQCPRRDFHNIGFCIKMKTAVTRSASRYASERKNFACDSLGSGYCHGTQSRFFQLGWRWLYVPPGYGGLAHTWPLIVAQFVTLRAAVPLIDLIHTVGPAAPGFINSLFGLSPPTKFIDRAVGNAGRRHHSTLSADFLCSCNARWEISSKQFPRNCQDRVSGDIWLVGSSLEQRRFYVPNKTAFW